MKKKRKVKFPYPLKWHRFVQIVLMPLMLVGLIYGLLSVVFELLNLNVPYFVKILTTAGMNLNHLGNKLWWLLGALMYAFLQILVLGNSWIGSFTWRKYSRRLWIFHLLLLLAGYAAFFYLCYIKNYQNIIGSMIFQLLGYYINPTFILVAMAVGLAVLIIYVVLNLHYYHKRRKIYGIDYSVYETIEEEPEQTPAPQPVPEAVSEPEPEPVPTENIPVPSVDEMAEKARESTIVEIPSDKQ